MFVMAMGISKHPSPRSGYDAPSREHCSGESYNIVWHVNKH